MENNNNVLEIRGLNSYFFTEKGVAPAVDGLDLDIPKGKIIGLVGESGCGKSMTAKSIMGLLKYPGRVAVSYTHLGKFTPPTLTIFLGRMQNDKAGIYAAAGSSAGRNAGSRTPGCPCLLYTSRKPTCASPSPRTPCSA